MSAASIKSAAAAALDVLFNVAGELVVDSVYNRVSGPFYDALTKPVQQVNACRALILNFHRSDIDGVVIKIDDEKGFVRTSEVPADVVLGPDDYLVESATGLQRAVIAARVDATRQLWVLQLRRFTPDDRGLITGDLTSQEDWGDLGPATVFEDWQLIN